MKTTLILLLFFVAFHSHGQSLDCFSEVKSELYLHQKKINPITVSPRTKKDIRKDTTFMAYIDSATNFQEKTLTKLIGCSFPKEFFTTSNGKEMNVDSIQSNFIILNLNYLYDDRSLAQLDDLAKLKKENEACAGELNENITIISFFAQSKPDIQQLIDKYQSEIIFVPDAAVFIEDHNVTYTYPSIYLLEAKTIRYLNAGLYREKERLFYELKLLVN